MMREALDSGAGEAHVMSAMFWITLLAVMAPVWAGAPVQEAEGWDFVPGEKLLLYDDFTDMRPGGQPPHWKVRKSVVKLSAAGRLVAAEDVNLRPNIVKWPRDFTIEQEFVIEKPASEPVVTWHFGIEEEGTDWRAGDVRLRRHVFGGGGGGWPGGGQRAVQVGCE
jgi:hypothetical protein